MPKEEYIHIRCSFKTKDRLNELCTKWGLTQTEMIERLVEIGLVYHKCPYLKSISPRLVITCRKTHSAEAKYAEECLYCPERNQTRL